MTNRERLIELLKNCLNDENIVTDDGYVGFGVCYENIADYLLANGVIVTPCRVGTVVWVISHFYKYTKPEIESRKILSVQIYKNGDIQYHYKDGCFWQGHIGKTVFLTKEEAEAELEKRCNNA